VRIGDMISAGVIFVGLTWFHLKATGFALVSIGVIVVWLIIALRLIKEYQKVAPSEGKPVESGDGPTSKPGALKMAAAE